MATRTQRNLYNSFKRRDNLKRQLDECDKVIRGLSRKEADEQGWLVPPSTDKLRVHVARECEREEF